MAPPLLRTTRRFLPASLALVMSTAGCQAKLVGGQMAQADSGVVSPDADGVVDDPNARSPWGVSTSASSSRSPEGWLPQISQAGIHAVRGFDQDNATARIAYATANHVTLSGILMKSGAGPDLTFPIDDLPGWSSYVGAIAAASYPSVSDWEVWNEPPNFTANTDPAAYASLVTHAYDAAKAVDANVRIGLAGKSVDINWLDSALAGGAAGHYDYITLHPYETLGLVASGGEAQFMSIVPTVRKMLRVRDPSNVDVPIVFTELGEPVGGDVSPERQATTVVKSYVLSLAQGVEGIDWFEGRDGDSGPFGLLDGNGVPRPGYTALRTLITELGDVPHYRGWILLADKHYGFVFARPSGPVLIAWAQPGTTEALSWGQSVQQIDPLTGNAVTTTTTTLTPTPVIIDAVPATYLTQAIANRSKPFPWGGDFSQASAISLDAPDVQNGLHPWAPLVNTTVNGEAARDCSTSSAQSFTIDPNFLSYDTVPIQITAVLKRNAGATDAGFNLKYESTTGTKSTGSWFSIPDAQGWVTQTWVITDAQFVGMWGYNFSFDSDSTTYSGYSLKSVTVTKLP